MENWKKIAELAETLLETPDQFLVEVAVTGAVGMKKVTVIIDSDKGITIKDCADMSRKLGEMIESENVMDSAYVLEVTSPGVGQPLKLKRQYVKNVGRKLAVYLNDNTIKTGTLESVDDESIRLLAEVKNKKKTELNPLDIQFKDIKRSNVVVSFK